MKKPPAPPTPIPATSEAELYFRAKNQAKEKRRVWFKEFCLGLLAVLGVVGAAALIVTLLAALFGGLHYLADEDKYATKAELRAVNARINDYWPIHYITVTNRSSQFVITNW